MISSGPQHLQFITQILLFKFKVFSKLLVTAAQFVPFVIS